MKYFFWLALFASLLVRGQQPPRYGTLLWKITGNGLDNVIDGTSALGRVVANGGGGHDEILGGASGDKLIGGNGNDILVGNDGKDVFYGGAGDDILDGGAGADTFMFDQIWDAAHAGLPRAVRNQPFMRDDLDAKGPVRVSEVEAAQKEILTIARRMADSGEIVLGGSGEQMI